VSIFNFISWNFTWRDVLDVAVVAVFVYYFLLVIRGTRAVQILQGVLVLLAFQALSYTFRLQTTYFVVRALVLSIVVALPLVFQPELRRALMQLGSRSFAPPFQAVSRDVIVKTIDEIAWAANMLAQTHIGALIVIARETGLEEFIETGVKMNADVSSKLLLSVFQPRSPLHDGAAIVLGDKIVATSCYLPLSETPIPSQTRVFGTRHRAAIGLTEQTDAIVVVVSEESGAISVAKDGKLTQNISEDTLKKVLMALYAPPSTHEPPPALTALQKQARGWWHFSKRPAAETSQDNRESSSS